MCHRCQFRAGTDPGLIVPGWFGHSAVVTVALTRKSNAGPAGPRPPSRRLPGLNSL